MRWLRRYRQWAPEFEEQARLTGERVIKAPESANYRGGTNPHSAVKGNGKLALTNRRLVFRKVTGGIEEIPLAGVVGTRRSAWFRGARRGRLMHLVVETIDEGEVGFYVRDIVAWEQAIADATGHGSGSGRMQSPE